MAEYTTKDAVNYVMNKDTASFKTAVNSILKDKISDAMEIKKVEVSNNFLDAEEGKPDENV